MSDVEAPPTSEQPQTIVRAVRLMWIGAALTALSIVWSVLQRDELREALAEDESNRDKSPHDIDVMTNSYVIFGVFVGFVVIGLWLWMAQANGDGKAWARTVATVLAALNVGLTLLGLAGPQSVVGWLLTVIELGLAAGILWLLYRPESTRFYDARTPG